MLITPHIAVGSAVGIATGNPLLALLAGIISHFLCDAIPHVDGGSDDVTIDNLFENKRVLATLYFDIFIAILTLLVILLQTNYSIAAMWGALGGILPDIVDNSPFWSVWLRQKPVFKQIHWFHEHFHFTIKKPKLRYLGFLTQFVLIGTALVYVFTR